MKGGCLPGAFHGLRDAFRGIKMIAAVVLLLAASACAPASVPPPDTPFGRGDSKGEIRIDILNHNFADVTVWMLAGNAQRSRLGMVTGKTDRTFVIPWGFSQPLRLEYDLLAGPRCQTPAMDVDPGDTLQLEIQADFRETEGCGSR